MTRGKILAAAAASSALMALASPASAAGFVNGSFEDNTCGVAVGTFGTVGAGNTCITGWDVSPDSVDLVREPYWDAHHGEYSVDLAGNAPGTISQLFDTVVGGFYTVNYWLSGNPQGGDIPKEITIRAIIDNANVYSNTFYAIQGGGTANMNYLPGSFTFTATGTQTLLSFQSGSTEGAYGAVLDAVEVIAPVPEPATWAMMLLGFGAIGFGLRKRNAQGQSRLRVTYA